MTSKSPAHRRRSQFNGFVAQLVIISLVVLALVGAVIFYYINLDKGTDTIDPIMSKVTRGEFVSQVLDQGEIQSSENIEIRCEVRARNGSLSVLAVCAEGTSVKEGDFLVQLDSTSFEKELEEQYLSMARAETELIQAESDLASAKAAREEFIQGTFEQTKKEIQNEIFDAKGEIQTAKQQHSQALDVSNHSKKLMSKGFITKQQAESDKFAVTRAEIEVDKAENSLALAEQKLEVLTKISFKKETVQLDADIRAADVKLISQKKSLAVEQEKLAEIQAIIEKCIIRVPEGVSGQVVFAKESSRGGNDWVLEEGTTARQNQVLVRLPNPEKMEVKALINEQSITRIEPGMAATIKVDALNNTTLKGVVTKVNQYAESSGWRSSSIRKYAVFVNIIDPPPALKPGMNSSVTIQVQYEPDVLLAPIQTIYGVQTRQFCLARNGDQWKTLEVEIGGDNSRMVFIKSGVEEGTELAMNPGAYKQYMTLPEFVVEGKIDLPDGFKQTVVSSTSDSSLDNNRKPQELNEKPNGEGRRREGRAGRSGGGGQSNFKVPASGAALIASKDTDGDGQLTKEEAGVPFTYFFDRIDTDGNGQLSESEADASVQQLKSRRQGGGRGGQRGGQSAS